MSVYYENTVTNLPIGCHNNRYLWLTCTCTVTCKSMLSYPDNQQISAVISQTCQLKCKAKKEMWKLWDHPSLTRAHMEPVSSTFSSPATLTHCTAARRSGSCGNPCKLTYTKARTYHTIKMTLVLPLLRPTVLSEVNKARKAIDGALAFYHYTRITMHIFLFLWLF